MTTQPISEYPRDAVECTAIDAVFSNLGAVREYLVRQFDGSIRRCVCIGCDNGYRSYMEDVS